MIEVEVMETETGGVWAEWWRLGVAGGMRVEENEVEIGAAGR